jgi:hypothetical protein
LLSTKAISSSRQRGQLQQQQVLLDTQWRSWDSQGQMKVEFETVAAGQQAEDWVHALLAVAAAAGTEAGVS